jgi:hypothetical protein
VSDPNLDRDGIPEVIQGDFGPLHYSASIRKKIVVNGTTYEDEASMPAEVREKFAEAIRAARTSDPNVKKNEIKVSFRLTGPGFSIGKARGGASRPGQLVELAPTRPDPSPIPIGPTADDGRLRLAITLGALAASGLAVWLLVRAR